MDRDYRASLRKSLGNNVTEESSSYSILAFPASKLPEQYLPLVYSKWLRSLRHGNPVFGKVPSDVYYEKYHKFIEHLMLKPDAIIRLAVLSDDHDVVLGFSVTREDVLDYVHVHKDHRKIGVAIALIPNSVTTFSHLTLTWLKIWQTRLRYKSLKFNPFA